MEQEPRRCRLCGGPITADHIKRAADRERARKTNLFCSKLCSTRWTAANRASTRGYVTTTKGYRALRMPDHPMADRTGYVMEHRAIMAESLGRNLTADEVVHHLNGDRLDNRLENLQVMPKRLHDRTSGSTKRHPIVCPYCDHEVPATQTARNAVRRRLRRQ